VHRNIKHHSNSSIWECCFFGIKKSSQELFIFRPALRAADAASLRVPLMLPVVKDLPGSLLGSLNPLHNL
jgi:hypothetical protein